MADMATLPLSRPLTLEDFEAIRRAADDGHRYELIDGSLVVTPSPSRVHQRVVTRLAYLLSQTNPDPTHLEVLVAPFDVHLQGLTVVQPDVLVLGPEDDAPPLLAVEVLSTSTRHFDIGLKRSCYASAGITDYWIVDPDVPSLVAWHLQGDAYATVAEASADEVAMVQSPWPVALSAAALSHLT